MSIAMKMVMTSRKIMNDKKLDIDGKSQNVEINDHYVIVSDGLSDNILNIFRNLK